MCLNEIFFKKHVLNATRVNSTQTLTVHKRDISGRDYFFFRGGPLITVLKNR